MTNASETIARLDANEQRTRRRRRLLTVLPVMVMLAVYSLLIAAVTFTTRELQETDRLLEAKRAELAKAEEDLAEMNEKRSALQSAVQELQDKTETLAKQERAIVSALEESSTPEQAVADVRSLVGAEVPDVSPRVRAIALWNEAYTKFNKGDRAGAEALYLKAKETDPSYAPPYNSLGRLAYERGDLTKAEALYKAALERDPSYAPALHNRSLVAKKQGRTQEAITFSEKALQLRPGYAPAKNTLESLTQTQRK